MSEGGEHWKSSPAKRGRPVVIKPRPAIDCARCKHSTTIGARSLRLVCARGHSEMNANTCGEFRDASSRPVKWSFD